MSDNEFQGAQRHDYKGSAFQNLIVSMAILEKNIGMYPPGHVAITNACESLIMQLNTLFTETPEISILSVKSNLVVNHNIIEANNLRIRNFAQFLSRRGIASIVISFGVTAIELIRFYQLILNIPIRSHIHYHPDIKEALNHLKNIRVKEIDLTGILFEDANKAKPNTPKQERSTIWDELIFGCLTEDSKSPSDLNLLDTSSNDATESFNQLVENFSVTDEKIAESYESVFSGHIDPVTTEISQISDKQAFFSSILDVLPEFSPELKEQILSITFEHMNATMAEKSLEELLTCIPNELILAVLDQAKRLKHEISPSLLKLVGAISWIREQAPEDGSLASDQVDISQNQIQKLFEREMYEHYVPEEYSSELVDISTGAHQISDGLRATFPLEELAQTLTDDYLNQLVVSGLLTLIDTELDPNLYADFVENITQVVTELLKARDYELLNRTYSLFLKHATSKADQKSRYAATNGLKSFSDQAFIKILSEEFLSDSAELSPSLKTLIINSGPKNIPWVLDQFIAQFSGPSSGSGKQIYATSGGLPVKVYMDLLWEFGSPAIDEMIYRLSEDDLSKTLALLKLIESFSDSRLTQSVRKLLGSGHNQVRLIAIQILLKIHDPLAITTLHQLLSSKDEKTALDAFSLVREYHVHELACELVKMIKIRYISHRDLQRNQLLLEVLGSIGNPEVMPSLQAIARTKFSFSLKGLKETQVILYQTLSGYPRSEIEGLISLGQKSNNELINTICQRITNSKST